MFDEHKLDASDEQIDELLDLEARSRLLTKDIQAQAKVFTGLLKDMNTFLVKYFTDIPKLDPEKLR